jgi:hypothetical protein
VDRTNLAHWEQLAVLHGTGVDHCYDVEKLVAGRTLMGDEAAALVRATAGAGLSWTVTQYAHGLAEVVMAAKAAGLTYDYREEHTSMNFDFRDMDETAAETDGRYRLRVGPGALHDDERGSAYPLPVLYTLLATKLAASQFQRGNRIAGVGVNTLEAETGSRGTTEEPKDKETS